MKALFVQLFVFLMSCNDTPEQKPEKNNRTGEAYVSYYKTLKNSDKNWYVILRYNEKGTYFYYFSSSKPVTDFLSPKWKTTTELPDELLNRKPEEVLTVPLSELPLDVVVPTQ